MCVGDGVYVLGVVCMYWGWCVCVGGGVCVLGVVCVLEVVCVCVGGGVYVLVVLCTVLPYFVMTGCRDLHNHCVGAPLAFIKQYYLCCCFLHSFCSCKCLRRCSGGR